MKRADRASRGRRSIFRCWHSLLQIADRNCSAVCRLVYRVPAADLTGLVTVAGANSYWDSPAAVRVAPVFGAGGEKGAGATEARPVLRLLARLCRCANPPIAEVVPKCGEWLNQRSNSGNFAIFAASAAPRRG